MLSHSMPKRIVSMSDRSYLCHSDTCLNSTMPLRLNALLYQCYTCPCQCSAIPQPCCSVPLLRHSLHYYSMPKPSAPLLCPCSAYLRFALASHCSAKTMLRSARALHRYSMPLLHYARLDLSVQCLGDSSPCLCSAYLRSALALLITALAPLIPASPLLVNAISIPNKAFTKLCLTTASQINSAS